MNRLACLLLGFIWLLWGAVPAAAARVGNFEVSVQALNKESGDVTHRGDYGVVKAKSQALVYQVKIELKGTEKLQDLEVLYIVSYNNPQSYGRGRAPFIRGKEEIKQMAPFGKFEFTTKAVENNYEEYRSTWDGGKSQWGKATLRGITLRIMRGEKSLAEFSYPNDMKDAWNARD